MWVLLNIVLPIDEKQIANLELDASYFQISWEKMYEAKCMFDLAVEKNFRTWELS
jgi:hypothetical protein